MDFPKFSARRDASRKSSPASVKDMAWASMKPATTSDLLNSRLIILVALAGILGAGMFMLRSKSHEPKGGYYDQIAEAGRQQPPRLPEKGFGSSEEATRVEMAPGSGKNAGPKPPPDAAPGEEQPAPAEETPAEDTPAEDDGPEEAAPKEDPAEAPVAPSPAAEAAPKKQAAKKEGRTAFFPGEVKNRPFQPPLDVFKPLEILDPNTQEFKDVVENIWDLDLDTSNYDRSAWVDASEVKHASEAIFLFYRFLRTHADKPEKIEEYRLQREAGARQNLGETKAAASHHNVLTSPAPYRGQPYRFVGSLIKKYKIVDWSKFEGNHAGIRDTWMLMCRDDRMKFYAVLVPQDMSNFLSKDDVDAPSRIEWTGLFVQRWSYVRTDNEWAVMPVYAALKVTPQELPDSGTNWLMLGIAIFVGIGMFLILRMIKKDEKQADEIARRLRARRAGGPRPAVAGAGVSGAVLGQSVGSPGESATSSNSGVPSSSKGDSAGDENDEKDESDESDKEDKSEDDGGRQN